MNIPDFFFEKVDSEKSWQTTKTMKKYPGGKQLSKTKWIYTVDCK